MKIQCTAQENPKSSPTLLRKFKITIAQSPTRTSFRQTTQPPPICVVFYFGFFLLKKKRYVCYEDFERSIKGRLGDRPSLPNKGQVTHATE